MTNRIDANFGTLKGKIRNSMHFISALWIVAFVFSFPPVMAEEMKTLGTPITSDNLVDVLEIQRTTSNLTDAVDSRHWDVIRNILADEVDTTIGETEPGVSNVTGFRT